MNALKAYLLLTMTIVAHSQKTSIPGERCQYQDECVDDEDCGRHGKCIDLEATTAPKKQCFCQAGFFGAGCAEGKLDVSSYGQSFVLRHLTG